MEEDFTGKTVINNEFDYSNILPTKEAVLYLVQYCDQMNKQLTKLVEADEEKNKPFKDEYKEYNYKHSFGQVLDIYIVEKGYNNITCKDYDTFLTTAKNGDLDNVSSINIKLCLDFYRGRKENLVQHENSFHILFHPYEIKFARKSNFQDSDMDQIENQINQILKQFPVANCIFCTKEEK